MIIDIIIGLVITVILVVVGYTFGSAKERRHFAELAAAEARYQHILVSDQKHLPIGWEASQPVLVTGSVVVATDYFKNFTAFFRNLFGGRIIGLERLVERGRREAIVRMLDQAYQHRANAVWCVRIETSCIGADENKSASGIEVVAYGTAMLVQSN